VGTKDEDWNQQGPSSQVNRVGFLVGTKDEDWDNEINCRQQRVYLIAGFLCPYSNWFLNLAR
jgi:hypothetical protein